MKKNTPAIKNEIIVQHNDLVEARYKLTLQEKRIILLILSKIRVDDDKFVSHKISIKDFLDLTGVSSNNMYSEMEKITMKLVQRGISINNQVENKVIQVTWLNSAVYHKNEGIVELKISELLTPYLLQLKNRFTKINLSDLIGLQSIYSIRIFELLKQYENIGKRVISLNDLRDFCGISLNNYSSVHDLKRFVLDTACKEINKKTDINLSYLMVKQGRKFIAVSFEIQNKNDELKKQVSQVLSQPLLKSITYELSERDRLSKTIQEFGFSRSTVLKMIDGMYDLDIEQAVKSVENQMKNSTVRNPKAMLRTALKERWKSDTFDPSKLRKTS